MALVGPSLKSIGTKIWFIDSRWFNTMFLSPQNYTHSDPFLDTGLLFWVSVDQCLKWKLKPQTVWKDQLTGRGMLKTRADLLYVAAFDLMVKFGWNLMLGLGSFYLRWVSEASTEVTRRRSPKYPSSWYLPQPPLLTHFENRGITWLSTFDFNH